MREVKSRTNRWVPNTDPSSIVVPGVDVTASVNDQLDQIDQLITIRLQNIDANFSRIQHLISTKLLPAFKRYAENTGPVREAAKFWKSFYETAAQVRLPIASDTSSFLQTEESSEDYRSTHESSQDDGGTPTNANSQEDSFAHGAPISSTPLVRDPILGKDDQEDSWVVSIESPFERLARQVKDLTREETNPDSIAGSSSVPSFSPFHGSYTGVPTGNQSDHQQTTNDMIHLPAQLKHGHRKGKSPLRHNVLRQNASLAGASEGTSTPQSRQLPRKNKTPKNPFLRPSLNPKWNGIVDLRQPSPARSRMSRTPGHHGTVNGYDSDSGDDLFPPGMSPPVTMQFAMTSRSRVSPGKLALTPARKAAEKIGHDFVAGAASRGMGVHTRSKVTVGEPSTSSVAPSLLSLTRYSSRSVEPALPRALTTELRQSHEGFMTLGTQIYQSQPGPQFPHDQNERALSVTAPKSDSDSDSSEHSESNPSAGFLFATQNNARDQADDSFASSQQSISSDEDEAARAARHPLAHIFVGGTQNPEDSLDQDELSAQEEEETVFGARHVGQGGQGDQPRLTIMQDALIANAHPDTVCLNPFAQEEPSPTPYARQAKTFI